MHHSVILSWQRKWWMSVNMCAYTGWALSHHCVQGHWREIGKAFFTGDGDASSCLWSGWNLHGAPGNLWGKVCNRAQSVHISHRAAVFLNNMKSVFFQEAACLIPVKWWWLPSTIYSSRSSAITWLEAPGVACCSPMVAPHSQAFSWQPPFLLPLGNTCHLTLCHLASQVSETRFLSQCPPAAVGP